MGEKKSIAKNFLYNTLLRILNIVFPLITFPYVARILSAEGIGKVDFSLSVIHYFIIIAQFGIPTYAIRECAKYRDNKEELTKKVQEILMINIVMVIVSYIFLTIVLVSVDMFHDYKTLLIIMSINILSTSIGIEWFYQSIEEYRLITIRSFFVKLLSLILVFVLIKEESDFNLYGFIITLSLALGHIYNFIHVNKYISLFKRYSNYNFKKHIKPILLLFAMSISVSIYVHLDKVMLGVISGDKYVGLYSSASRIVKIILTLVTSLAVVLLPRMSYYIKMKQEEDIKRLIKKSIDFILMISIPATVGIIILAKPIILIFAGPGYLEAVNTIRIISPILIIIGLSNLIGIQILVSNGKEKITLFATIIGAAINFSLNLILIPKLQHNGAAVATILAETAVTVTLFYFAYTYIKGNINFKNLLSYLIGVLFMSILCIGINHLIPGLVFSTLLSVISAIIIYISILFLFKNELMVEISTKLTRKFKLR
ncbi:flippase [Fredinandcohnia sp. 179-A 10B2 NHS]|uniref:flippase n=1 Tax=Fredinandcohnia sp. 179-A 10B2 NHS TaxID=3235176 RepID=UPI0039A2E371